MLGLQLVGELADLGQAALAELGGGELVAGPLPGRQHPGEGAVEAGVGDPGEALQVALGLLVDGLVAVAVGGEAAPVEPGLQQLEVVLALAAGRLGEAGQLGAGDPVLGESHDGDRLAQVRDQVLHEPDVGGVGGHGGAGRGPVGGWARAASRHGRDQHQGRDRHPSPEPASHPSQDRRGTTAA